MDDLFDVGGGRTLHLTCLGTGSPTVLLEAGGGSAGSDDWPAQVVQPLSAVTRTCTYDRAGTGASDPAPNRPRGLADLRRDVDAVLRAARVEGKLLLVGPSFGGTIVLDYALTRPARVAGLVVLDSEWPTSDPRGNSESLTPPEVVAEHRAGDRWNDSLNVEHVDFAGVTKDIESRIRPLGSLPVHVVVAKEGVECYSYPAAQCARNRAAYGRMQQKWLTLGPGTVLRDVAGTHDLNEDNPDAVLAAIEEVLQRVRA